MIGLEILILVAVLLAGGVGYLIGHHDGYQKGWNAHSTRSSALSRNRARSREDHRHA